MRSFGKRRKSGTEIIIGFVLFILAMIAWYVSPRGVSVDCEIRPIEGRSIENSSVPIRESWSVANVLLENFWDKNLMVSTPALLIAANTACDRVIAFHLETGSLAWARGEMFALGNITLDYPRGRVYVSGLQNVTALSVDDGYVLWINTSNHFIRNAHIVVLDDNGQLTVENNGEWSIDPDTGELSPVDSNLDSTDASPTPEEKMRRFLSTVGSPAIASNVVNSNNIIYALDEHAQLHFIRSSDGTGLGSIEFEPPVPTNLLYEPGAIGGSWLAVENDLVAIYFQDIGMLAVYELEMP